MASRTRDGPEGLKRNVAMDAAAKKSGAKVAREDLCDEYVAIK